MRAEALAAARRLIVEGETDLTMRAVADAANVTYPNLSHHFGSAAGLHAAIAEDLVRELLEGLRAVGEQIPPTPDFRGLVDRVFDLFGRDGLGRVLGWLVRSGEAVRLQPISDLLETFITERGDDPIAARDERVAQIALVLSFAAYAESSVGSLLGEALKVDPESRRRTFASLLSALDKRLLMQS
jgi:AcrR family transcriptional regulator